MIIECFATSHTEHILSEGKIDITDSDAAQQIVDEIKRTEAVSRMKAV
jgi:hypothetical protein